MTYFNSSPVRGRSGPRFSSRSTCSIRHSYARMPSRGKRKVVAFPLAPTLCLCMCRVLSNMLPHSTSIEKHIIDAMQVLAHAISINRQAAVGVDSSSA